MCKQCKRCLMTQQVHLQVVNFGCIVVTLFAMLLFACILATNANAADIGCGRDTDRNGNVDNWCPGVDKDFDGYTLAQGDCDDEDWNIQPGRVTTKGCSAGEYRTCKASGAGYTACVASATTPYCPTGDHVIKTGQAALNCYYFNAATGSNATGDGSYANPWQTGEKISTGASGAHSVVAGDAFIFINGGTAYPEFLLDTSKKAIWISNKDGTSSNPIYFLGYPGNKPVMNGRILLYESDYHVVRDFELTPTSAFATDNQDVHMYALGAPNYIDIAGLYIHDTLADRYSNVGCINVAQGGIVPYIHHNYVSNCLDKDDPFSVYGDQSYSSPNIYVNIPKQSSRIEYNSAINSTYAELGNTTWHEACIQEKHMKYEYQNGYRSTIKGNYCLNAKSLVYSSGAFNRDITNNLFVAGFPQTGEGTHAITIASQAGTFHFGGTVIENNTTISSGFLGISAAWQYRTDETYSAQAYLEKCSCEYGVDCGATDRLPTTWVESTVQKNIIVSTRSTFNPVWIGVYSPDITYTLFTNGGDCKYHLDYNGYYSSGSSTLKLEYFTNNTGCTDYCCSSGSLGSQLSGLANIRSGACGWETNAVQEDPQLASGTYIPANTKMATWGYAGNFTSSGTPGTTQSTLSRSTRFKRLKR